MPRKRSDVLKIESLFRSNSLEEGMAEFMKDLPDEEFFELVSAVQRNSFRILQLTSMEVGEHLQWPPAILQECERRRQLRAFR